MIDVSHVRQYTWTWTTACEETEDKMARVCAFPGCGTRMRKSNPETFHRLPLRESNLKQWLVVLQFQRWKLRITVSVVDILIRTNSQFLTKGHLTLQNACGWREMPFRKRHVLHRRYVYNCLVISREPNEYYRIFRTIRRTGLEGAPSMNGLF